MENQEFYQTGYYNTQFTPEKHLSEARNVENFIIDDLLDFPNDDSMVMTDGGGVFEETVITGASTITAADTSSNSASTGEQYFQHTAGGAQTFIDGFSSELCVPYDDLAELEWLSSVVDESISCEDLDLQKMQLYQGMKARNTTNKEGSRAPQFQFQPENTQTGPTFHREMSVPAKARSKRSRTAPGNWTSRLLAVSPSPVGNVIPAMSSSSESDITVAIKNKSGKQIMPRKKDSPEEYNEGRKCLHCATDKTPQWRTGPMGPKTLCNACGVRYKSGRLVPEYRPAASPTFVLTKHSNSHRKVLELRRQKDMVRAQHHQHQHQQQHFLHPQHQSMMFDHVSNGDEYLIHQHIGPDYRQLI